MTLRQKMIVCFLMHLVFYGVLGFSFYHDFQILKENARLFAHASKLANLCSEIRRYEEDFIIRRSDEYLKMTQEYTARTLQYLPFIASDIRTPHNKLLESLPFLMNAPAPAQPDLSKFAQKLKLYQAALDKISAVGIKCRAGNGDQLCMQAKAISEELTAMSEHFLSAEQQSMDEFVERFKTKLVIYLGLMVLFTLLTSVIMYNTVLTPLQKIEHAAHAVAIGSFRPLPVPERRDEVHSVIRAFNTMVENLEQNQEQLFQAKKLSSIGTLASGTAHQLNNPLNNISTSCQIALEELKPGDEFIEKMLKIIEQESYRASEIVKGLLEFSRVQNFSMAPSSLNSIIDRVFSLAENESNGRVELKKNLPHGDIILNVDQHKITEALLNLVINGIQAMEGKSGTICISAVANTESRTGVVTVSDSGKGIPKEHIHKIFDPFFTTKSAGKGTGLGLAVVYGIIRKHRGTIRVKSNPGEGTEFIITLPLAEPTDKKDNTED